MAGMSDREPVAWAVFDGIGRMHMAEDYSEAESFAENTGGEIAPLYRAPRWIPVEEQWPRHGSDVLVVYKCGEYVLLGVGEFDGTTVNDEGLTVPYFKGINGFDVTHWMPLPEPPEVK